MLRVQTYVGKAPARLHPEANKPNIRYWGRKRPFAHKIIFAFSGLSA